MPIVAPDVLIAPTMPAPRGMSVAPGRSLVVETNGVAGLTARALSGSAQATPIDSYGVRTAGATALPAPLAASGRWLVEYTGDIGGSAPLAFT